MPSLGIKYGKQHGSKVNMDADASRPPKPKDDFGICNVCDARLSYNWRSHINKCDNLPIQEINDKFTNDPMATISTLVVEYKLNHNKLRSILISKFGWTRDALYEKGLVAKLAKHKAAHATGKYRRGKNGAIKPKVTGVARCKCYIIVERKGDSCEWCIMESHGIKSYHDMHGV